MRSASTPPNFPPGFITERVIELGFGSGPWTRPELIDRWPESTADKFILEAKKSGWLVSPFSGEFYVPPAQDLMTVSWLSDPEREELIISRTLAAAGLRNWCLSAWARMRGLEFPSPLFVTDLAIKQGARNRSKPRVMPEDGAMPPVPEIIRRSIGNAKSLRKLPFLDNLILVPWVPQQKAFGVPARVLLPRGDPEKEGGIDWVVLSKDEANQMSERPSQGSSAFFARSIRYVLSPRLSDPAWAMALLAALELPRIRELLPKLIEKEMRAESLRGGGAPSEAFRKRIQAWSALIGRPAPNVAWRESLRAEVFPFLLIPKWLWEDNTSATTSARHSELQRIWGAISAEP